MFEVGTILCFILHFFFKILENLQFSVLILLTKLIFVLPVLKGSSHGKHGTGVNIKKFAPTL